ncbi:STAS domain-containing protein [Radiobacillus sp. PE A8.2]|uniref:STAS domain-containing protein n=1 Tax=Radiobacillus sp. PE A8.2 TaxID=3380349 RepID=UPI00388D4272
MVMNERINVAGLDFNWNVEKGEFQFEERDAVLFWIKSAMKVFFDTIEEISGIESYNLVLETAGFRQGIQVGEYFEKMKEVKPAKAAELITHTYAAAGWGKFVIEDLDIHAKTFTAYLTDSWEHKINVAQEKQIGGDFLPAHFAGIFTGLFDTNMWYEVKHFQLEGYESTKIEFFPSNVNISDNIHQLARKKEMEHIVHLEALVEDKTRDLKDQVKKLSSPIIPVLEGIVVVPLIGEYDEERSEELFTKTLYNLPKYKASYLILDLSGIDIHIDLNTAVLIERIGVAASLIGTKTILVGISAGFSQVLTKLEIQFSTFDCFHNLQHGVHFALAQLGSRIVKG